MDMDHDDELQYDFFPFIRQYKSGRVVRFGATVTVPAGTDDDTGGGTGVTSKDVVINPSSGFWARLYLPAAALPAAGPGRQDKTLPVVVYYHGGAFVIGSTAHRPTHKYLNRLAADANVLLVSPEYRLAPEHPLPTAHDDSWEALRWVASHATTTGEGPDPEPWLVEHGDLTRVFLAGVSAGGNIAHNVAERAGAQSQSLGVPIRGLLLIHPYFTGVAPVGREATETATKARSEAMWRYVCPGTPGPDDPLANPFSEAAGGRAARVAAKCVLVCVAEKGSGYRGEVELHESVGEGHVFHYRDPACEEARALQARVLRFLRTPYA